jgi:hypothetical protein
MAVYLIVFRWPTFQLQILYSMRYHATTFWTYASTSGTIADFSVEFVAGIHDDWDSSDPYLIDDRGLWFDGKYDFIVVKGLKVHTKFVTS